MASKTQTAREMKVLAMGLPRTGTASIAEALTQLGYQNVFHGLNSIYTPGDWKILNRAALASFPNLPDYTGVPFSREEWDELLGSCEGTTDVTSVLGTTIIKAYPEAKVILVIRPFEKWWKSMEDTVLGSLFGTLADLSVNYVEPIIGSVAGPANRNLMYGLFRAKNVEEIRQNARATYDRHHEEIRALVPKERLLEYRMGDGWEPICEFLDKEVPDIEFPWVNETEELKKRIKEVATKNALDALKKIAPWAVGLASVGFAAYRILG